MLINPIISNQKLFKTNSPELVRLTLTEDTLSPLNIPTSEVVNTHLNADLLDGYHLTGEGNSVANTTPTPATLSTQWGSQTGTARKVAMYNAAGELIFDYIKAYDIFIPSQISAFYVRPSGSYPDGTASYAMVASSGTDTMQFRCDYLPSGATITSLSIDILSYNYTGGGAPEINGADYPDSTWTNYCNAAYETSQAINRALAVLDSVTFRATAVVDGQTVTKDVTLTYYNERIWGHSADGGIDTDAEITSFRSSPGTGGGKELSNTTTKTITLTFATTYFYYIFRAALNTPTFTTGGFPVDMQTPLTVSWTNPRGKVENMKVCRSTNLLSGALTIVITAT